MSNELMLPLPVLPMSVRIGTRDDLAFIDALQKKYSRQVGFMPTRALEGKIANAEVLIAEQKRHKDCADVTDGEKAENALSLSAPSGQSLSPSLLGYLIGQDRYFKRDDVGIIYAINIVPSAQRGLVGATLLKAQFDRSAYGCKLYCRWCAQDLAANKFWEAMGFVPLAFRSGGRGQGTGVRGQVKRRTADDSASANFLTPDPLPLTPSSRIHLFWQKRIRAGDTSTPWWYPSQTTGGSIREDRIVLSIPPGVGGGDAGRVAGPERCRRSGAA